MITPHNILKYGCLMTYDKVKLTFYIINSNKNIDVYTIRILSKNCTLHKKETNIDPIHVCRVVNISNMPQRNVGPHRRFRIHIINKIGFFKILWHVYFKLNMH